MAAPKKIRVKEGEKITDENIEKVLKLFERKDEYKTKKELYTDACNILHIAYNTSRLDKIIASYKQDLEDAKRRKAEKRGKPATDFEIQSAIESFLDGDSISEIAKRLYRGVPFVKQIIEQVGVPQKVVGTDFWNPALIPDKCVREEFSEGQIVWSAKYNSMAIVLGEESKRKDKSSKYYRLWIIENIEEPSPYFPQYQEYGGFYSGSYAYDLASLDHLKEYGVDVYRPYRQHFTKWLKVA